MIKVTIVGAKGYTGGELFHLLCNHPNIESIDLITRDPDGFNFNERFPGGNSNKKISVTMDLDGETDVIFLCLPHGKSKEYYQEKQLSQYSGKIIDLSTDHRYDEMKKFTYGLTELNQGKVAKSNRVANPGCFATGIQLSLIPVASVISPKDIHITALTGSTGAGTQLSETSHFSWRQQNVSVYKSFSHQHLNEIYQTFSLINNEFNSKIHWVPMRGCFTRGIFGSIYFETNLSEEYWQDLFSKYYLDKPFVNIIKYPVNLKQVVNTNQININISKYEDQLHITFALDNLLKGAAGQALENMNLMCGFNHDTALQLKPSTF